LALSNVRITNGFPNTLGRGVLLTGVLMGGNIKPNDILKVQDGSEIPIIEVEFDHKTFPGTTHVVLTIQREFEGTVVWRQLYGKTFEIIEM
jgi:hypothetical protein